MTLPAPEAATGDVDLILVGAGLASALIAQRLSALPTPPRMLMLEGGAAPFGVHTWSFHDTDIADENRGWLAPLVAHRWGGQSVRFAAFERHLSSGYASLTSNSVAGGMDRLPTLTLRASAPVADISADHVVLASGEVIRAACIIDARGYAPSQHLTLGYQKFVGLEVETEGAHGLTRPIIMDASVDQRDGYRFVYTLPFSSTRLLIEDTRYSDGGALDGAELAAAVRDYAAAQGWRIARVVREEQGVLPISLAMDFEGFWGDKPTDVPQAGMRAALFHPTTGYSLPEAVRVAALVGRLWPTGSAALAEAIRTHARGRWRAQRFYRFLDRMLFRAALPERRHLVLQRFYRLPQPLIERFYAGKTTRADMARILIGRPPVPIRRALSCVSERSMLNAERT